MTQVILIVAVLSICDVEESLDPNLKFEIQRTWSEEGSVEGLTPVDGKSWQLVQVNVTNQNRETSVELLPWYFFAYTDTGERIWAFNSDEGAFDPIDPGHNSTVILIFDIPGGSSLTELEYIKRTSSPVRCVVPQAE
ncbi:MAG: hypothetical protein U9R75_10445 [Candidatus Thermoplasmatota archaeon]|nr:hypothetical protein [Candidatus Thermoplasmatota archaeon]